MRKGLTPSQTIGPFFHNALPWKNGEIVAGADVAGVSICLLGQIADGAGDPVPDALVEIWQANAAGRYAHGEDTRDLPLDNGFSGFGRAPTDADGHFRFETIKPGPVPGRGNTLQAPHVNITIFARGLLNHLSTRLYFDDEADANYQDPVLNAIDDAATRNTLIATKTIQDGQTVYALNICLQGDGETVFFDL